MKDTKIRVLLAKPDLDGHDRGAKVVGLALKDAGMDVIYTGLHSSIEKIVALAKHEKVDIIGLSIMTGAHLSITKTLFHKLKQENLADTPVVVGGVIPKEDIEPLQSMGVKGVFPGGTPFQVIVDSIQAIVNSRG